MRIHQKTDGLLLLFDDGRCRFATLRDRIGLLFGYLPK